MAEKKSLGLAFGKKIETGDEEVVRRIVDVVHELERVVSPGAYLVDVFPILMNFPSALAPFKRELEGLHQKEYSLFRGLLDDVRDRMKDGTAPKCWERDFLEQQHELNLTDDQGAYGTYITTSTTTASLTELNPSCRNNVRSRLRNYLSRNDVFHARHGPPPNLVSQTSKGSR